MTEIIAQVERLNALIQKFDDCRIESFNGDALKIIGCYDLCYHHNFEAEFGQVSYVQCATYFFAQGFRVAKPEELPLMNINSYVEEESFIFCFEADADRFSIVAQTLELREGLVLHHKREP